MKKQICFLFLFIFVMSFTLSSLFGGAVIVDFKGEPSKNKVILKWSTLSETNCQEFQIERSLDKNNFEIKGSVKASGNSSVKKEYIFKDSSVFKSTANTFYYRIRIINFDETNSLYSEIITVTPSVSGVKHTWGSLKALFR